jgi:hypothetical protein
MAGESTDLTPYPGVNIVLNRLLSDVKAVLADRFVGLYLYGSLASGDFNPAASDVDFLAVTDSKLSEDTITALAAMHARIAASRLKWASKLEGSYLAQPALQRYDPTDETPWPTLNEGRFYLAPHGPDWVIQRHVLREHGVVVAGPPPQAMIDAVQPDELRQAVRELLQTWWATMLDDPLRLQDSAYQAYAILSMCRALHALRYGAIVSKPVAARWAQQELGEAWASIIEQALAWRYGVQLGYRQEALDLIRHTITLAHV